MCGWYDADVRMACHLKELYPAKHGWCVADMPIEKGAPIYNATQAERAWGKLLALYKAALV